MTDQLSYDDGTYLADRDNHIWLVVRDGGMATRADYTGVISMGIKVLEEEHGPLDVIDPAYGQRMRDMDQAFYDLTVKERNLERVKVDRLEREVAQLRQRLMETP